VIVYAESSAVLCWLLGESRASEVARILGGADRVVASVVTGIECARAVVRGATVGAITRVQARALIQSYRDVEVGWDRVELHDRVMDRAGAPFPVEPIRTLDAIHVASAAIAHEAFGPVTMLSFDERVRANAAALGLPVLPVEAGSISS
jgi:predicted nucleic acid-binding protein